MAWMRVDRIILWGLLPWGWRLRTGRVGPARPGLEWMEHAPPKCERARLTFLLRGGLRIPPQGGEAHDSSWLRSLAGAPREPREPRMRRPRTPLW